jgi:hypothetical protein
MCFGLAGRNWPYLQACLQAGEAVMPQSASVIVFNAVTVSLASPTRNDDDEGLTGTSQPASGLA